MAIDECDETNVSGVDDDDAVGQSDPTGEETSTMIASVLRGTIDGKTYTFICREPNGFQLGLMLERILFATDDPGSLNFIVKWKDTNRFELVSSTDVKRYAPDMLLDFYEARIVLRN